MSAPLTGQPPGTPGTPGTGATAGAVTWRSIICEKLSGAINTFRNFIDTHIIGKSLTDREVALDLAPQDSGPTGAINIDDLIERNPKRLAELLADGKLKNLNLDKGQCNALAMALAKDGKEGATLLAGLFNHGKLEEFDPKELQSSEANALAMALAGAGKEGVACLQKLLADGKLKNLNLDEGQCNALAMALVDKDGGVDLLTKLLEGGKLENLNLGEWQCNTLAMALAKDGKEGVGCLQKLLAGGKLKNLNLGEWQCKKFVLAMAGAGKEGATLLAGLFNHGKLEGFNPKELQSSEANAFAIAMAGAGKESIKGLRMLFEKEQLKTDNWSTDQHYKLAKALAEDKPDGVALLTTLIEKEQLKTNNCTSDQHYNLALALAEDKPDGVALLTTLFNKKQLKTADWSQKQCNEFVLALVDLALANAKDGVVGSLTTLLTKHKLPKFQLPGCDDNKASQNKAIELLSKNTPEALTELKRLIGIGLNGLIGMTKSNITTSSELIETTKSNGFIGIDKLKNLINKIKSRISDYFKSEEVNPDSSDSSDFSSDAGSL
jgi:hypothetical protein